MIVRIEYADIYRNLNLDFTYKDRDQKDTYANIHMNFCIWDGCTWGDVLRIEQSPQKNENM